MVQEIIILLFNAPSFGRHRVSHVTSQIIATMTVKGVKEINTAICQVFLVKNK